MNKSKKLVFAESITIIVFMTFLAIIMKYHEPWFDEAQSWLIARDSSFFDMIWNVLRYEGHPPLWYIVLYIPSHLGIPYEIGLKSVNFIFITLTVILLVKKSPFPTVVRLSLPFTYFIFYQYGVISRSYSLFAFILFLVALNFPSRNQKPFKFAILLGMLCGVLIHGILIAFGIVIAWLIEIFISYKKSDSKLNKDLLKKIFRSPIFYSLSLLAFINIIYLLILWPKPDRFTLLQKTEFDLFKFLFNAIIDPLNGIVFNSIYNSSTILSINIILTFLACLILTVAFFIWIQKKGILLYILIPYTLILSFMSLIYFARHHTGIYTLFFIFSLWITLNSNPIFKKNIWLSNLYNSFIIILDRRKSFKYLLKTSIYLVITIQIYWSVCASLSDIDLSYCTSRDIASFIKEYRLENYNILNCTALNHQNERYYETDPTSLPYFEKNIFYTLNNGEISKCFITHKKSEINSYTIRNIISVNKPDILIDTIVDKKSTVSDFLDLDDYITVKVFYSNYIWKDLLGYSMQIAYVSKELYEKHPDIHPILIIENESE
ncbi:MAG TPA: hypothetical protein PK566_06320 [Pseudobacteroides sp.]|nr:hypothetical protein [Pseudobacteroides sp.]